MIKDIKQWADFTFAGSQLGDKRRNLRLLSLVSGLTKNVGKSVVQSSEDSAAVEGNYRLIRNPHVKAEPIAESGFMATVSLAQDYGEILALEDTTTLTYSRENMDDKLGHTSSAKDSKRRGFFAHSVLLFSPEQQHTIGLIEQYRWVRDSAFFGKANRKKNQPYEEKESYKWERASRAMSERLGAKMQDCISVCDRESDAIEYMSYKQTHGQRFVVRVFCNRPLEKENRLLNYLSEQTSAGNYQIRIPQRGGRSSRKATLSIKYARVSIMAPERKQKLYGPLPLYAVSCQEVGATEQELHWTLLTTEPVENAEQARKIASYYEARWRVELFHKVWKTQGTNVESLKMETFENLEKMAVILSFIACRLMQLKDMGDNEEGKLAPCTLCLTTPQWRVLYTATHKKRPDKNKVPSVRWAYQSLGKLAGWNDSKRTGRVGWKTLNEGLTKLDTMVEALELFGKEM